MIPLSVPADEKSAPLLSGILKQSLGFFLSFGIWIQKDKKIERQKDRKTKR